MHRLDAMPLLGSCLALPWPVPWCASNRVVIIDLIFIYFCGLSLIALRRGYKGQALV